MKNHYDLLVIGGGSAGVRAARLYAAAGKRVVLVEAGDIGGTCVNVGCVPKKLFAKAAHYAHDFALAVRYGWVTDTPRFDWETLVTNARNTIKNLHPIYLNNLQKQGAEVITGYARFISQTDVEVATQDGKTTTLSAEKYIIATGGTPAVPECEGKEHIITSDHFFTLPTMPRSIMVSGGGYIALELASLLQGLGVAVTVVHRSAQFLRGFENDIGERVVAQMRHQGIVIRTDSSLTTIAKNSDSSLTVTGRFAGSDITETVDCVLAATGRVPNIAHLGLDAAGVSLNSKGAVAVDAFFQTSNPRVYALGDVMAGSHQGHLALTPIAIAQAKHLIALWAGERSEPMDYSATPSAVFVQPTAASVGLSEEQARSCYDAIDVAQTQFSPLPETMQPDHDLRHKVWIKLVIESKSDTVVGIHMIGEGAEDMMQIAAICVKQGFTRAQLNETLPLHPSVAEELVLL